VRRSPVPPGTAPPSQTLCHAPISPLLSGIMDVSQWTEMDGAIKQEWRSSAPTHSTQDAIQSSLYPVVAPHGCRTGPVESTSHTDGTTGPDKQTSRTSSQVMQVTDHGERQVTVTVGVGRVSRRGLCVPACNSVVHYCISLLHHAMLRFFPLARFWTEVQQLLGSPCRHTRRRTEAEGTDDSCVRCALCLLGAFLYRSGFCEMYPRVSLRGGLVSWVADGTFHRLG
jgi:hypothetical protein